MFQHPLLFLFTHDSESANLLFFVRILLFLKSPNKITQRDPFGF